MKTQKLLRREVTSLVYLLQLEYAKKRKEEYENQLNILEKSLDTHLFVRTLKNISDKDHAKVLRKQFKLSVQHTALQKAYEKYPELDAKELFSTIVVEQMRQVDLQETLNSIRSKLNL